MELTVATVHKRLESPWIGNPIVKEVFEATCALLANFPDNQAIILPSQAVEKFWGKALACIALHRPLVLFDNQAPQALWQKGLDLIQPALILSNVPVNKTAPASWPHHRGMVMIPTGGSGGRLKFAMHSWGTLTQAAEALWQTLGQAYNCISSLALHHVSGFMPGIRSWIGKTQYTSDIDPQIALEQSVISLVPTQLERLFQDSDRLHHLRKIHQLFLGGGPTQPELLGKATYAHLPIGLSYGMTETAAMVTLQKAEAFLQGQRTLGQPLPHAQLEIDKISNRLVVKSTSCFYGYFPKAPSKQSSFETGDYGEIASNGTLLSVRRADRLIISGGEKIDPTLVEATLMQTGYFKAVHVKGEKNPEWGEQLVAYVISKQNHQELSDLKQLIAHQLPKSHFPKKFIHLSEFPTNAAGKITFSS